ncbi:uncharacterized protein LOC134177523 [Corticium candelabrum]|uniref:uncharacterized protein LOC134177523 n=1 Tax=Corticium candelabrum TaxID=121492 RepID=UPI002E260726|nr:uncharacterized protein LOC134177523 [Corticium candelabrum]
MKSTVHQTATIQSQTETNDLLDKATNGREKTTTTPVSQSRTTTSASPGNIIHTDKLHIPTTPSNYSCSELPLRVFIIMAVASFVFITLIVIWIIWKFYKRDNTNKKEDKLSKDRESIYQM